MKKERKRRYGRKDGCEGRMKETMRIKGRERQREII